jgi:hypothetical protein
MHQLTDYEQLAELLDHWHVNHEHVDTDIVLTDGLEGVYACFEFAPTGHFERFGIHETI